MTILGDCSDEDFEKYGKLTVPEGYAVVKTPDGKNNSECVVVKTGDVYTVE